jgi:hypothetical protein
VTRSGIRVLCYFFSTKAHRVANNAPMTELAGGVHPSPAPGPRGGRAAWYVAFTLLLAGVPAAWNISSWPTRLRYPGELDGDGIEGVCLAEMQHLRQGVPVYAPASPERFDAMIYGPLYFSLGARLIDPERPAFLPLRIMSLVATLGCTVALGVFAFWVSRSRLAVVFVELFFLSYGFISLKGLSVRCDMAGLVFVFWGFLVAYKLRNGRGLLYSVPLILLGLFFKQQFVAAPLAVFLFLLLERRYRLAAGFVGLLVGGGTALLACFHFLVYPGQSLLLHLVNYNIIKFSWNRFGFGLLLLAVIFGVPLLLALEFLRRHPDRLLSTYLGCAVLAAALGLAREGSGTGYFLELFLIICAPLAALVVECRSEVGRRPEILCLLGVSLLAGTRLPAFAPNPQDFVLDRAAVDYLRHNFPPGTEGAGRFPGELIRAGLQVPISDIYQYSWLMCRGTIPATDLVTRLEQRKIGVILFKHNLENESEAHQPNEICLKEAVHRAILQNYRLATTLPMARPEQSDSAPTRFYVWVPRP